tara:strand:+ start:25984 stop:26922 length:939 start_codon:yes stop_codon:yes gene_type:complete
MKIFITALLALVSFNSFAINLWPTIPFVKGADLCQYQDAYGRSRSEMAQEMVSQAERLIKSGASGKEALDLLVTIDALIDKNRRLAVQGYGLDVTLEATLKSYVDALYQQYRPRSKNISFTHAMPVVDVVRAVRDGQRPGYLDQNLLSKLDGFAWGTYAYAPNCRGEILVTIHIVNNDGSTLNFHAQGKPQYVMSTIAARMFEQFQRAQFPSRIRMGSRTLELVGAPGAPVDRAPSPFLAQQACEMIDARLPTRTEYEYLSMLGDWNGGIGLGLKPWALADGFILAPTLRNPSPIRRPSDVNDREFKYYCVR